MAIKNKSTSLTKNEVLKKVVDFAFVNKVDLTIKQAAIILESYEKVLLTEWKEKGEFKFLSIGKFKTKMKPAREGVNPLTGVKVKYPEKNVPKFTFNKAVKEFILNNSK